MAQFISAHTLPGTKIGDIDTDWEELSARTHRQAKYTENPTELWYYRNGGWALFPVQPRTGPDDGIELNQTYKQPYTCSFTLPDQQGLYAPENLNSAYNYRSDGTTYDPLLDEARKICLRAGTHCYTNLAVHRTCTTDSDIVTGSLSLLTDLVNGTITAGTSQYVLLRRTSATPYYIQVDLGSVQDIKHTVIRFASHVGVYPQSIGVCSFPVAVTIALSQDGSTWTSYPTRRVGDNGKWIAISGDATLFTCGDWGDSATGETREIALCDLDKKARYVRWTMAPRIPTPPHIFGDVTWSTHAVDELAVYGGSQYTVIGANLFTGYLGDQIEFNPHGDITCSAVDPLKKLADNNDVFVTAAYRMTQAGAIELGDIVYSLLNSTAYWRGIADYDTRFSASEIGWADGGGLTGLQYPLWQGQSNSMLGYCAELFGAVGFNFYADGNGVLQATEPPYNQKLPDRVCVADNDGNYDVQKCERHRTGKQLRNKVIVQTGKGQGTGSGTVTEQNEQSARRFGTRTTRITNPIASTADLRQKVAGHFLRDYAWNLQTLSNVISPQFETKLKQVFGFRAPARPNLHSLGTDDDADTTLLAGKLRLGELWSLVALKHRICYGRWVADAEWIPYVALGPTVPNLTSLASIPAVPTQLLAVYDNISIVDDPSIEKLRVYVSTTSQFKGFTLHAEIFNGASGFNPWGITSLTAVPTWVYMTSVDIHDNESAPSVILSAVPGSTTGAITDYTITDFACNSTYTDGPDSQGVYTYQFFATWTAPAGGFTRSDIRAYVGASAPPDPDNRASWSLHNDSWNWWGPDRILQGLMFDNQTPGQLEFTITFRSKSNLSGLTMWWHIWNSTATRSIHWVSGNSTSCVVI